MGCLLGDDLVLVFGDLFGIFCRLFSHFVDNFGSFLTILDHFLAFLKGCQYTCRSVLGLSNLVFW